MFDCDGLSFCNNEPDFGFDCYVNNEFCEDFNQDGITDSWVGDGWCDDGAYAVYPNEEAYNNYQTCQAEGTDDCSQYLVAIDLWCAELNFDERVFEVIDEGCTPGFIEDCNVTLKSPIDVSKS